MASSSSSSSAEPRRKWPPLPSLSDIGLTAGNQADSNLRLRQAFAYHDDDDYADSVLAMDEQEQEELIAKLRSEDLLRNHFYCKTLFSLTVAPILFFIIRYFYLDKAWLFNTDLFFAASLALSALAVPTVITRPTDDDDDDDVCLRSPGAAILHAQRMNIVVSALLCVWTWARMGWGIGNKPQYHEDYLCAVPFMLAAMGHVMRKMMEAVNFGELEHLRYEFKGA